MTKEIIIHTKSDCPYCTLAKEWLDKNKLAYTAVVHDDVVERNEMYDSFGLENGDRTVPQIFVDGVRLGGYTALLTSGLDLGFDEEF